MAYATGDQPLGNRLTRVKLANAESQPAGDKTAARRSAVHLARLIHNGDCMADPKALTNLARLAVKTSAMDIVSDDKPIDPGDEEIFKHPVLFMTGHFAFTLTDKQVANLAKHLRAAASS